MLKAEAKLKQFWKKPWFICLIVLVLVIAITISVYLIYFNNDAYKPWNVAPWSFGHKSRQIFRIRSVATTNGDYFQKCSPAVTCDSDAKYRTYNGSCNNLNNPNWGAALTPFYRLMNAEFNDSKEKNYTWTFTIS